MFFLAKILILLRHLKKKLVDNELLQNIKLVFTDGTFGGSFRKEMEDRYNIGVEIPNVPVARKEKMEIHEKRWTAERTIFWILNNRRSSKDYERKTDNVNAFIFLANIRRLTGKIYFKQHLKHAA
jgi:hypothetical protein